MTIRTIAVVTGTRAEYGLLEPVMRAVAEHDALELRCVVTGTHLTTGSVGDIAFPLAARVPMQRDGETGRAADAAALGRGVSGFASLFDEMQPDVVLVLGDRIEAFAAAAAGSVMGLRVAHVHGGDRAEGVADEAMRHAITKLAHLHFPATAQSRRRLLRLGEDPAAVWNVGSPAVDGLSGVRPAADAPRLIVMMHPVGDNDQTERGRMAEVLAAAAPFDPLVLMPNHDPGRGGIVQAISDAGIEAVDHLPRARFLSLLAGAASGDRGGAIVGNSSAGLIEAAVLRVPCVNVGSRQAGRETPPNVRQRRAGPSSHRRRNHASHSDRPLRTPPPLRPGQRRPTHRRAPRHVRPRRGGGAEAKPLLTPLHRTGEPRSGTLRVARLEFVSRHQ